MILTMTFYLIAATLLMILAEMVYQRYLAGNRKDRYALCVALLIQVVATAWLIGVMAIAITGDEDGGEACSESSGASQRIAL